METHILIGSPHNLYVFDYKQDGLGSAPFNGDINDIEATWEPVQRYASVGGSRGTLYRRPQGQSEVVVKKRNTA